MNIVVPAAGRGSRFVERGYSDPKPLIPVLGRPLIKWSTEGLRGAENVKFTFVVQQEHIDTHNIDAKLTALYGPETTVIPVNGMTEGQASTVLLAKDAIDPEDEMAVVNCDNLFLIDLARAKSELSLTQRSRGIIFYIAGNNPAWSYVETDKQGLAVRVAEKEVISDKVTVGCYYFTKARYFMEAAELMVERDLRSRGEFYVSPTYNLLIEQGGLVHTWPCDLHFSLGTPEEVDRFLSLFAVESEPGRYEAVQA